MIMSLSCEDSFNFNLTSVPLVALINNVVKQRKIENNDIRFENNLKKEIFALADGTHLLRIISNIFNNALESQTKDLQISIEAIEDNNCIKLYIRDYGSGMSQETIRKISQGGFTTKLEGKGIGLITSINSLKSMGGELKILSKVNEGTTVEITLPTGEVPSWYCKAFPEDHTLIEMQSTQLLNISLGDVSRHQEKVVYCGQFLYEKTFIEFLEERHIKIINPHDALSFQNKAEIEYVLIDDDKYVRRSWEISMKSRGKGFVSHATYSEFKLCQNSYSRYINLFLDRHLGDVDILLKLQEITDMGFENITLISSDIPPDLKLAKKWVVVSSKLPPD